MYLNHIKQKIIIKNKRERKKIMGINYDDKAEQLGVRGDLIPFIKFVKGKTVVTVVNEEVITKIPYREKDKEGAVPKEFLRLIVQKDKDKMCWDLEQSRGFDSVYGQVVLVGKSKGKLVGQKLTVNAIGEGMNRRYLVEEAQNLMPKTENVR